MGAAISTEIWATVYQKIRHDILKFVLSKLTRRIRCKRKAEERVLDVPTVRAVLD